MTETFLTKDKRSSTTLKLASRSLSSLVKDFLSSKFKALISLIAAWTMLSILVLASFVETRLLEFSKQD